MATYRVTPLPDGVDNRYGWQVLKNGRRISKHELKSAAKRRARTRADDGDTVQFQRTDGTFMPS